LAFFLFVCYVWVWFVKGICSIERGNQRGGKCISVAVEGSSSGLKKEDANRVFSLFFSQRTETLVDFFYFIPLTSGRFGGLKEMWQCRTEDKKEKFHHRARFDHLLYRVYRVCEFDRAEDTFDI